MKKLEIIDFFYKDRCFNVYLSEHDFYSIKETDIEILNHKTNNKEVFSVLGVTDDIEKYKFEYIFLTNESISISFIKQNDLRYKFVTFIDLQNDINLL